MTKEITGTWEQRFMRVSEVAALLDCSESHAYKVMQKLNKELETKGKIVVKGRISKKYLLERVYL